jgi:hypothetical protein
VQEEEEGGGARKQEGAWSAPSMTRGCSAKPINLDCSCCTQVPLQVSSPPPLNGYSTAGGVPWDKLAKAITAGRPPQHSCRQRRAAAAPLVRSPPPPSPTTHRCNDGVGDFELDVADGLITQRPLPGAPLETLQVVETGAGECC